MQKIALIFIAMFGLLTGCASSPQSNQSSDMAGALMVVRLQNRLDPPTSVYVEVQGQSNGKTISIYGKRYQSVPGKYADYLVALALPMQQYILNSLRDGSMPNNESIGVLASLNIPIAITSDKPVYLGRFVLDSTTSTEKADVDVQDHFEEDTVAFRSSLSTLRNAFIKNDVISRATFAALKLKLSLQLVHSEYQWQLDASSVDTETVALLTPKAHAAFTKFLKLKLPRAFALDDLGKTGLASGVGAVERALKDCSGSSQEKTCRIFAVDNTYFSSNSCTTYKISGDIKLDIPRGCPPPKAKSQ